mgnify:CR=1 FL=1
MKTNLRKNIELGVLFGLICSVILSFARFDARCDELRNNVLRLHIIANSDSAADQKLKLDVRDEILESSLDIFNGCTDITSACDIAETQLRAISEKADAVIKQNGFDYSANATVGNSYFETREYDDFTLPAGTYKSLIVRLGEGKGKNWWCVIFPAVCLPAAAPEAELSDSTTETGAMIAEHPKKYVAKFKAVEIYEDFKKFISRK